MSKMKLSKHAMDAINGANSCAQQMGHDAIGCEHILLSLLAIPDAAACRRFAAMGMKLEDLTEAMRSMIAGNESAVMQRGQLPFTGRTKKVLELAQIEAGGPDGLIGTEALVVAMMREGENAAAQMLFNAGIGVDKFLAALNPAQDETPPADAEASTGEGEEDGRKEGGNGKAVKTPTINAFGRDLTELARSGKSDPVIGRSKEIRRLVQILSRRTKNNAVLIGEAGVGKTAVVEGLAQAMASGDVPERMLGKRVVALDMARVVAGTQYRGQFEERLKKIVDETRRAGNIVLFLDEIHTMVGAGGAEGAMDAANILKPALARGELQCVGATTLKEYHKSIEKDAALERRFQPVQIDEPSVADSIEILKGIAPRYEEHHGVRFSREALKAAVELTARYLPSRQLPDKAIDAMDETGARLRIARSARPQPIVELQNEIAALRRSREEFTAKGAFDQAANLRSKIAEKKARFDKALSEWRKEQGGEVIGAGADDVAETVSIMSGVPLEKMDSTTAEKLLSMEKDLAGVVVGQDEAVKSIARSLRRSRALLGDPRRPIGSFLFLGPTGVGKTYLARMLADKVYGDEKALITIDMSEFQEKYSSSRLVGAPPGYVGYDEGGQLTEKVRRRPYSVVLFDEFEKANADVMNMLLQIMDDGRLTDGQGRVVDFRNTIIICTANLGFDFAREGRSLGFQSETIETSHEVLRNKLIDEAKKTFRPELLNRYDDTVVFKKLDRADVEKILKLELDKLQARLKDNKIKLSLDRKAVDFLVEKGYSPSLGARPLRRVMQTYVEDPLAEAILAGKAHARMKAKLASDGKSLKF